MEKRIWNEQELQSMPEFFMDKAGDCWNKKEAGCITSKMLSKTVEWCRFNKYIVKDWMIANTDDEKHTLGKGEIKGAFIDEPEIRVFNVSNPEYYDSLSVMVNRDGTITYKGKTYIEKPTPKTVTLDNGTVLEVGKKYVNRSETIDKWWFEIASIGIKHYECKFPDNDIRSYEIELDEDVIPYTEQPAEQPKEWKTFLIESEEYNKNGGWSPAKREIVQMCSIEDAKRFYTHSKITEVKVNIEEVK